jgi:glucose 1-dehydrogenase
MILDAFSLAGKKALVTGAGRGIGKSYALALAEAGADVAVLDRSGAADAAADIAALGRATHPIEVDLLKCGPGELDNVIQQVVDALGGIDILVNNAGIDGPRAMAWEADPTDWERVLRVDLLGAFHCAREALKRMVAQRSGVVLNLTSVHEKIPWSGYSAYTAAKAGLAMTTRTMAQEAAPFGVRVVALAPGAIRTPINRSVWSDKTALADLLTKIPLDRMGEPEEIARVAVFLVSDAASYLTGSTVYVDGGMTDYPDFAHGG